ncbi:hypothetical protein C2E21_0255 [Chlorella sorokiniana]|uniref:Uncharacterized protein n=1 Tax=Chlorella sorokiniana TaxID=3076 RepID=A0A2P6U424_CHLSO|nr:hypothetical protein C2E21_0255 [Chlorella sorokiniana]|eukprot:PRW61068.1 hypothetical protein C2E21_0255 [Chlorella sorokiniana]
MAEPHGTEEDVFDGLDEPGPQQGAAWPTDDIEAALAQAEALLGVGGAAPAAGAAQAWAGEQVGQQHALDWQPTGSYEQPQRWGGAPDGTLGGSDTAATEAGAGAPHRPPSAFSLGESVLALRLTVHEKQMELLQLRAQYAALAEQSQRAAQQADEALTGRDSRVARLEEALARREAALDSLTAQLQAYRGLTPDGAVALQTENAALTAARVAAEERAAELERRNAEAARRVQEGVATWERLQAELQGENARLAAALARLQSQAADLAQEKEVMRARVAMLEARGPAAAAACVAALPSGAGTAAPEPRPQQGAVQPAASGDAHDLQSQLAAALQKLEGRQQAASKYKEAVRALKRRVADLEQQLAQQQAAADEAAQQAQAGAAAEVGTASRATAALQQCEQQLAEARQQCEEYGRRLVAVEGQLQKTEFARAQWEWRAQDAEQRAATASEAAEEANAAAARLLSERHAQAKGRAADVEAQAKAASLRALQLEKQLAAARQELGALRQQQALPALQQQLQALRRQLVAAQQQQASTQQQLQGKAAALAAAEKRLRQFEAALRQLAAKQGSGGASSEDFLIAAQFA